MYEFLRIFKGILDILIITYAFKWLASAAQTPFTALDLHKYIPESLIPFNPLIKITFLIIIWTFMFFVAKSSLLIGSHFGIPRFYARIFGSVGLFFGLLMYILSRFLENDLMIYLFSVPSSFYIYNFIDSLILSPLFYRLVQLARPLRGWPEWIKAKDRFNRPFLNSFFDYYAICSIYALTLSLFGGILIYEFMPYDLNTIYLSLIAFYAIEITLLYLNNSANIALDKNALDEFSSLRSWPTPGTFLATPLLLLYFLIRLWDFDYWSWDGLKKIWIISIYLITNPRLPKLDEEEDATIGKLAKLELHTNNIFSEKEINPVSNPG